MSLLKNLSIILIALLLFLINGVDSCQKTTISLKPIQELMLNESDVQQFGMIEENCFIDEQYSNIVDSSLGQYGICNYNISSINTSVTVELQKFANYEALNETYQYQSSHLFGIKGLISENAYGDQSRFRINSEDDYGAQYNPPGVYFYHLWICKNLYLIHVTSAGSKDAGDYVINIGKLILSKLE